MPFGTRIQSGGRARFSLWAPGAEKVELCLEAGDTREYIDMPDFGSGWHVLDTGRITHGGLYRFRINGGLLVPDPASRYQPSGPLGPSMLIAPESFDWPDEDWNGRPWEEAVFYELHVGTFSPERNFAGVERRLDYIAGLGITAIELMPIGCFPGQRSWGYDCVLPFAPASAYGTPNGLKSLVASAHAKGIMVFIDVCYNHLGPVGNYLGSYAPQFFRDGQHTPWGDAICFDGPDSRNVREFFMNNAQYWVNEYSIDGLRLDAADRIIDRSSPHIITELARAVRKCVPAGRHVHLVIENDNNQPIYLKGEGEGGYYNAQWNDDIHHVLHMMTTGETTGCYADYADRPEYYLGRCLAEGFAFQGEPSGFRGGTPRGDATKGLDAVSFVNFIQNHDQVGNRPGGERMTGLTTRRAVEAATGIIMLSPAPPLIFMGEEYGSGAPFTFFCDLGEGLAPSVREGRRKMYAISFSFQEGRVLDSVYDPSGPDAFTRSTLDFSEADTEAGRTWTEFHRRLIEIRRTEVVPHIAGATVEAASYNIIAGRVVRCEWRLGDGTTLSVLANMFDISAPCGKMPAGRLIYTCGVEPGDIEMGCMPPWSLAWFIST